MKFYDIQQGSDEHFALRRRKFTSSEFKDLFAKPTTQAYKNAIMKVVFERLTGESPEEFENEWMKRGKELEAEAREEYELMTFNKVKNGGFFEYNEWIGSSPDGIVEDGLIEIKCPKYSTHLQYLLDNKLPKIYEKQVQGQMFVTELKRVVFVSYHPGLNSLILEVKRDEELIKEIDEKLKQAISKAKEIIKKLKS